VSIKIKYDTIQYDIKRLSRLIIDIPILDYLGFSGFWGHLATSDAKSDVIFLLSDHDFRLTKFGAYLAYSFRDLTRDKRTDDRRGDGNTRLLHLQCASLTLHMHTCSIAQ